MSYSSKFHETVKTSGGYNIYRMKGSKGVYHVDSKQVSGMTATFKTQKEAVSAIKNSFRNIVNGGKM